jgi:hypothetical protein
MKTKVNALIENLILSTNNDQLAWKETGPASKRSWHREFIAIGEDGTEYETEIKFLMIGENWQLDTSPHIWVKNGKLPNGRLLLTGASYNVQDFRKTIMDKYCADMNPTTKIVEDILEDITKGVSTSTFRDSRINNLLDDKI